MKKMYTTIFALLISAISFAQVYEFRVITSVESIVPMGIGRSRLIETTEEKDYQSLTTSRSKGNDSKIGKVKRKDAKVDNLNETKLLNFYSGVGINFRNIASNDALITSMLNQMSIEGWELMTVVSGVESDAGEKDGKGIFITRFIFKRIKE
jgi:hypothetical protein